MIKQVADLVRELFAAFVIAGVLRRDDGLGGFLANFLEYLVDAAVEQVARVGAFGSLVLPLLDKFEEILKLYPQIHCGYIDQRELRLHAFKHRAILLPNLLPTPVPAHLPTLLPTLLIDLHRLLGLRRFDVLRATGEARAFAGVTGRPVRIDPHQQRVAVAIESQINDALNGARGRAFVPKLLPRAAPEPGL